MGTSTVQVASMRGTDDVLRMFSGGEQTPSWKIRKGFLGKSPCLGDSEAVLLTTSL